MNDDASVTPRVLDALERLGPSTGAELRDATGAELFALWRVCRTEAAIEWRVVGQRYLRLDRKVDGYARLSPSTKREFLTYTVMGLAADTDALDRRVEELVASVQAISDEKRMLARYRIRSLLDGLPHGDAVREGACFLIAGDVVYGMAHAVDRPEISTGKMVRGSDLDIVIVTTDDFDPALLEELDRAVLTEKHQLLHHPTYREEIDYVIKPMARVREQLRFDTFEHCVASKILDEAVYLDGSRALFDAVKAAVAETGVREQLARLGREAAEYRETGDRLLSGVDGEPTRDQLFRYFYTKEEEPEIY